MQKSLITKQHIVSFLILLGALAVALVLNVQAQAPPDITFPISELGNCESETACRSYCNEPDNIDSCIDFAERNGLMESDEVERARKVRRIEHEERRGPGGCSSQNECQNYCEEPNNFDACIDFAQEQGFISADEAAQARKFQNQAGPGDCRGNECWDYCEDPNNFDECIAFAEENDLVSHEEAARARKIGGQSGPGDCRGERDCRNYCEDPEHFDECLAFAQEHDLIDPEDARRARLVGPDGGPGGCRGERDCRNYCEGPEHFDECIAFAEEHDFMSADEAARARKFQNQTGPGGCRGDECRVYCEDPDNTEACIDFAVENGLMPAEEAERAKKFLSLANERGPGGCRGEQCRIYCEDPEREDECFAFAREHGLVDEEDVRRFEAGKRIDKKLQESGGPGGCVTDDECRTYCSDPARTEECIAFAAAHGGVSEDEARRMLLEFTENRDRNLPEKEFERMKQERFERFDSMREFEHEFRGDGRPAKGFAGPGDCTSPVECMKFCSNPQNRGECGDFAPPRDIMPFEGGFPRDISPDDIRSRFERENFDGPIPCSNPEECRRLCSDPGNSDVCEKFMGEKRGGIFRDGEDFRDTLPGTSDGFRPDYPVNVFPPTSDFPPGIDCKTPEECKRLCLESTFRGHPICQKFFDAGDDGFRPDKEPVPFPPVTTAPPCNSPETCKRFCTNGGNMRHDICRKFFGEALPQPGIPPYEEPRPDVCPTYFAPICGTDGRTYSNDCVARSKGVVVRHPGSCENSETEPTAPQNIPPFDPNTINPDFQIPSLPEKCLDPNTDSFNSPDCLELRELRGANERTSLLGSIINSFFSLFRR